MNMQITTIPRIALVTLLIASMVGCDNRGGLEEPEPESPAALRYFPLAVGNVWEYERFGQASAPTCSEAWTLSGYLRYEIQDEVIVRGKRYFQLSGTEYGLDGVAFHNYVLTIGYDTTAARIVSLRPDGSEQTWFASPCRLDTPVGEAASCGEPEISPYLVSGSETWTGEVSGEPVAGVYKRFDWSSFTAWYSYVQDVGLVSSGQFDCGGTRHDLIFARVEGHGIGMRKIPVSGG